MTQCEFDELARQIYEVVVNSFIIGYLAYISASLRILIMEIKDYTVL